MTLDELVTQLKAAHGDALLGVVLYGSTAADSGATQTRGHNVLVVVRTLDVIAMQAGGAIGRSWQEAGNAVPLTLTDAEWRSSVDVFAIEHADIAERHRVLHAAPGFGVSDRVSIRDDDVRRQLEYEALALTLAVRSAITRVGRDTRDRRALLASQASRAVALLRAAVRLSGAVPAPDAEALCAQAATLAGFDAAPFVAALRQRRGTNNVPKGELDSVLDGFHTGLTRFVAYLDGRSTAR
jgi:hypothetical protein